MPLPPRATPSAPRLAAEGAPLADFADALGPALLGALKERGFTALTQVQAAVLAPALRGRDLRISSQTGSGKTVALGLAVRDVLDGPVADAVVEPGRGPDKVARPRALVVVPTRELVKQVEEELTWLFQAQGTLVAGVAGGGGYRDELRSFRRGPAVVVATPGRLLDHLRRGSLDATAVGAVVLDEADRMLDMGFREDLEAIFGFTPEERRTHLVSATFPREVRGLADRVQNDPAPVQGTPLGAANADIDHVLHLVKPEQTLDAIVNMLLAGQVQTLLFVRTRADVSGLGDGLRRAGFRVATLSGEMEQAERNRALAAFKAGGLDALVATDVAARGIDVPDIARVIHVDPPGDSDTYTHRSGRTGRAGRKGTSITLVEPPDLVKVTRILGRAKVSPRVEPVPTADAIRANQDEELLRELTTPSSDGGDTDPRTEALARRLTAVENVEAVVVQLLKRLRTRGGPQPRDIVPIVPPAPRSNRRVTPVVSRPARTMTESAAPRGEATGGARREAAEGWTLFRVSWGDRQGADARRLLAVVCRRGGIRGADVGAIRVGPTSSTVEVASALAEKFETAAGFPDPQAPRIVIRRWQDTHERPARPFPPKTHEPKPFVPKPRDSKPAAPKPRDSKPFTPKPRDSKPFTPKPRAKVHDAKPFRPKPHEPKAKAPGNKHFAGKPFVSKGPPDGLKRRR